MKQLRGVSSACHPSQHLEANSFVAADVTLPVPRPWLAPAQAPFQVRSKAYRLSAVGNGKDERDLTARAIFSLVESYDGHRLWRMRMYIYTYIYIYICTSVSL